MRAKAEARELMCKVKGMAAKREGGSRGWHDGGDKWEALPQQLKALVDSVVGAPQGWHETRSMLGSQRS